MKATSSALLLDAGDMTSSLSAICRKPIARPVHDSRRQVKAIYDRVVAAYRRYRQVPSSWRPDAVSACSHRLAEIFFERSLPDTACVFALPASMSINSRQPSGLYNHRGSHLSAEMTPQSRNISLLVQRYNYLRAHIMKNREVIDFVPSRIKSPRI